MYYVYFSAFKVTYKYNHLQEKQSLFQLIMLDSLKGVNRYEFK